MSVLLVICRIKFDENTSIRKLRLDESFDIMTNEMCLSKANIGITKNHMKAYKNSSARFMAFEFMKALYFWMLQDQCSDFIIFLYALIHEMIKSIFENIPTSV